jgi:hypothetical protein
MDIAGLKVFKAILLMGDDQIVPLKKKLLFSNKHLGYSSEIGILKFAANGSVKNGGIAVLWPDSGF